MKYYVEGEAIEFVWEGEVLNAGDRLTVRGDETATALAVREGDSIFISYKGNQYKLDTRPPRRDRAGKAATGEYRAPMPGLLVDVLVAQGDSVVKGQKVLVLEAMKTQQPFIAPFDGKVKTLNAKKGEQVAEGALLAEIEPVMA